MSRIKRIFIDMDNLTGAQQLDLWRALYRFAEEHLESGKDMMTFIISKDTDKKIREALRFVRHLKEHDEVKNAPAHPGVPVCKVCGKTIHEIAKED